MLPCSFYAKNSKKEGFDCDYCKGQHWHAQLFDGAKRVVYKDCPKIKDCIALSGEPYKDYKQVNTVINYFGDGRYEVVRYSQGFKVPDVVLGDIKIDRRKNFKLFGDVLVPCKDGATISKLEKTLKKASKRAQDNYFGYALTNEWTHFFTFTMSSAVCNRYDDSHIKQLWSKFRQKLQQIDKDIKILCVPERHKKGALHFHALINFSKNFPIVDMGDVTKLPQRTCKSGRQKGQTGFCTFDEQGKLTVKPDTKHKYYFMPYYEFGKIKYSKSGEMLFVLNFYEYGISSCAFLPKNDQEQMQKVINYLITYTTKECNMGYCQKRYFRTHNLNFKNKIVVYLSDEEFEQLCQTNELQFFKSSYSDSDLVQKGHKHKHFEVHRNFNTHQATEEEKQAKIERLKR